MLARGERRSAVVEICSVHENRSASPAHYAEASDREIECGERPNDYACAPGHETEPNDEKIAGEKYVEWKDCASYDAPGLKTEPCCHHDNFSTDHPVDPSEEVKSGAC